MKIVVVSDTHIPSAASTIPSKLIAAIKKCDLLVHAGDITEYSTIEDLSRVVEVRAVSGNMDSAKVREKLPQKLTFKIEGVTVGVTHGRGSAKEILSCVKKTFSKKVDIIIFGHSHLPCNETVGGVLYFNPGSPTDKTFAPYRSYGVIDIQNGVVKSEIVRIDD